jgi:hypothetical protein
MARKCRCIVSSAPAASRWRKVLADGWVSLLKIDVQTEPKSNGGVYFHSKFQEDDWPKYGYEVQVNNTHEDPRKTGGLYQVQDVKEAPAKDGEWFTMHVVVKDKTIKIDVDGKQTVDFTEAADRKAGEQFTRKLDRGTFALQAHDPESTVRYKNIRVKRLERAGDEADEGRTRADFLQGTVGSRSPSAAETGAAAGGGRQARTRRISPSPTRNNTNDAPKTTGAPTRANSSGVWGRRSC